MIDRLTAIEQKFSSVREAHANGEIDILNPAHHASWSDVYFLLSRTRQLREALETLNVAVKGYRAMVCGECGGSIEECVDGERLDSAVRAARAALEQD